MEWFNPESNRIEMMMDSWLVFLNDFNMNKSLFQILNLYYFFLKLSEGSVNSGATEPCSSIIRLETKIYVHLCWTMNNNNNNNNSVFDISCATFTLTTEKKGEKKMRLTKSVINYTHPLHVNWTRKCVGFIE